MPSRHFVCRGDVISQTLLKPVKPKRTQQRPCGQRTARTWEPRFGNIDVRQQQPTFIADHDRRAVTSNDFKAKPMPGTLRTARIMREQYSYGLPPPPILARQLCDTIHDSLDARTHACVRRAIYF
jgi:hypothetical protein